MGREDLERAIVSLEALIAKEAPEGRFQELFEASKVLMETLGYVKTYPRPRLTFAFEHEPKYLTPDFLCELPLRAMRHH